MRAVFVCAVALLPLVLSVPTAINPQRFTGMSAAFEAWMVQHNKEYSNETEKVKRLEIFTNNAILVEEHNAKGLTWTMALNQFADLTNDEFVSQQMLRKSNLGTDFSPAPLRHHRLTASVPDSVDWRTQNLVTPVKNQGQCGSCWAFSTVVSFEGQASKSTGSLVSYSEQDLVDCVKGVTIPGETDACCDGCKGGLMDSAFEYMITKQSGKDDTESAYSYKGVDGTCSFSAAKAGAAAVSNYTDIAKGDEASLKDAVANVGPISVAVDANMFWQLYGGGVFKPLFCNQDTLNHGVAVVGYGTEGSDGYWIIKNSWGATWGEKGYMRMVTGKNVCGVANSAVYPNV
jgi:C1A family cysteine protease